MRRCLALSLIAAILSVSSIPLMPNQPVCAHAGERMEDCTSCHGDPAGAQSERAMHASHQANHMGHDSGHEGHSGHEMAQQNAPMPHMHGHDRALTDAEKECRIECGCGCHLSADGLPFLLSQHVTVSVKLNPSISVLMADTELFTAPEERAVRIPLPPPQIA
jgi:hypothetical protein